MFFFTVVCVLAYAVALGTMFLDHGPGPFSSLPLLDQSMGTLSGSVTAFLILLLSQKALV